MSKVVGQDRLVCEINRIFDIFVNSEGQIRPHFFLTGSSGSGKTFTIKTLCKDRDLNFIEVNAAQLTKEGFSGNSLSKALSPLLNYKGRDCVVFVDEFDKLFISGNSNSSCAHESTTGVQNEFLKVLESDTASVFGDYGKYINVDVSQVLFVFAGTFNNEENISIDKLRDFGVKTEFLWRVGLVYNTAELTLENMFEILEDSDLLKTYLELFDTVRRENVIETVKEFLESFYLLNTIVARIISTLIHQYFIRGGKLGFEEVKKTAFQKKLELVS